MYEKSYIWDLIRLFMEGYRSVSLRADVYARLKELSERTGKSMSRVVEELLSGSVDETSLLREILENTRKILEKLEKLENLEARIGEGRNSVKSKSSRNNPETEISENPGGEKILKAFLSGGHVRIRGLPLIIGRAEFFVEGMDPSKLAGLAEKYMAAVVPEMDSENNVAGVSIVPNIGFSSGGKSMQLEEWFERYGRNLLAELISMLRGVT